MSKKIIEAYYAAFNQENLEEFCSLLADNVAHDINQGKREIGMEKFKHFMQDMFASYKEEIRNLIIFDAGDQRHYATEFMVYGTYIKSAKGLPSAKGQNYQLAGGAFFEIENNKITRVTNYYNLNEWLKQVE